MISCRGLIPPGTSASARVPDRRELPEQRLLRAELNHELETAMQELPANYRSVVLLRDVEGLSTTEAADVLNLSEDVVKQRLHRGRLALRKRLAGYLTTVGKASA